MYFFPLSERQLYIWSYEL